MEITIIRPYQLRIYELIDSYLTFHMDIYLRSCIRLVINVASLIDDKWAKPISYNLKELLAQKQHSQEFMMGEILPTVKHMLLYYRMAGITKEKEMLAAQS